MRKENGRDWVVSGSGRDPTKRVRVPRLNLANSEPSPQNRKRAGLSGKEENPYMRTISM